MMKACIIYRTPKSFGFDEVMDAIDACSSVAVGPLEKKAGGFVPAVKERQEHNVHRLFGFGRAVFETQERILPSSAVKAEVSKRCEKIAHDEGRTVSAREKKAVKVQVLSEMLPVAFVAKKHIQVHFDKSLSCLFIGTTSQRVAEQVIDSIRDAAGSFHAVPATAESDPEKVMTGWVAGDTLPYNVELGDECELSHTDNSGAFAKCKRHELRCPEVAKHIEAGKVVSRVGIIIDDRFSISVGSDLVLKKIKPTEKQKAGDEENIDADYALFAADAARIFQVLDQSFKIKEVE